MDKLWVVPVIIVGSMLIICIAIATLEHMAA